METDQATRPEHLELPELQEDPISLMPKQDTFIFSEKQFCGYGGGVGNGKSMSGIIKVYNHCQEFPGAFFLIGRRHATDLRDSTLKDFLQMMRGYGHFSPGINTFKFPNGSEVIFRHLDDLQALTNMNLSGFWVDQAEEISEEAFDYLVGRCRRQKGLTGAMITHRPKMITFNPNGRDWIWRRFYESAEEDKYRLDADGRRLANDEDYELVMATTLENRENLPEDYLKGLLAAPEEWQKRFVQGSFDTKAGRIFELWNPQVHVIWPHQYFPIPQAWERFRMVDHGQNNPTACEWGAVDFEGNMYLYDEYYRKTDTVTNHVRYIKDKSMIQSPGGLTPDTYRYTVIDPSSYAKTREKDNIRFSVADEYMESGIPTVGADNNVNAGIDRVNRFLQINPERRHPFLRVEDLDENHPLWKYNVGREPNEAALGSPRLFVFARCENLRREIPEYAWQPLSYANMGRSNNPEKPVKNFDHAVDAMRYGVMSRPVNPLRVEEIEPGIWEDPMRLSIYAKKMGTTVDDLIHQRFRTSGYIRKTEGGIKVQKGL